MRRMLLVALILLATAGCDQATKRWARNELAHRSAHLAGGHVQLVLAENEGAFLSMGDRLPERLRTIVFTFGVGIGLAAALAWLLLERRGTSLDTAALALVLGGGFGNLIDRATRAGSVTDFILLRAGPLHTGVFNIADVCVTFGVLALFALSARRVKAPPPAPP